MARHKKNHTKRRHPSEGMKSAVAYTFASLFSKGLAFITVPIFTRIMSTSEMGTVNLYNSWQAMLTVVATLSLTYGGYMVALKEYQYERDQYESSVLTLTTFTAVIFFAVYSIAPDFWSRLLGLDKSLLVLMLVGFLLLPATEFWLARQRYEYKYKAATLVTIGSALLASAFSIYAVLYLQGSGKAAEGRLYANYIVLYAVAFVLWIYIMVRGRKFVSLRYWKFSLALSIPLIANQFATQILNNSGRVMIGWYVDNSAVGIYGTLSSVSTISAIIWSSINSSFVPFLYRNIDDPEGKKKVKDLSSILLLTYAVICVMITFLAPEVVRIIATNEYMAAIYIMPPISAAIFQNAISNMYANVLLYHKKSSYIMIASICGAILNIVLNIVLIPLFGYQAAAYSMLVAFIFLSYVQMHVSRKLHCSITHTNETVYDDRMIVLIQWVMIALSAVAIPLYDFIVIRYMAVCFLLVASLLLFRKSRSSM
ncbi:oligosaccharide flippase family protein [Bifidobacterium callimiconis]|uniref:oligosaccharide flippase family protein n=1 Tax=Bifidobacterium callimiconis TaxID=2306973 RepID=UPI001BDCCEA0|nr:oligosaccharide flippase family protein [Bifidobacterium callimiconis]MBT1177151.1 oligosaccharide flippase family protein [Bifidobacterium callimiconis]